MRRTLAILATASSLALAQSSAPKVYQETFAGIDSVRATIYTGYGPMVFRLYQDKVPQTVANFVALADAKFYDGLLFHRVIPGFMAQGGDPKGDGTGGPGWNIKDEFDSTLKHVAGALSMANAGPGTTGSQFFVVQVDQPHLNGKHNVFGMIRSGWDVSCLLDVGDKMDSVRVERYKGGKIVPAAAAKPAVAAKPDSSKVAAKPAPVAAKSVVSKPVAVPVKADSAKTKAK